MDESQSDTSHIDEQSVASVPLRPQKEETQDLSPITQPLESSSPQERPSDSSNEGESQTNSLEPTTAPAVSINWENRAKERRKQRLAHYKEIYQAYCRLKLSLDPKAKTPALGKFIEQLNQARQDFIQKNNCSDVRFRTYINKKNKVVIRGRAYLPSDLG